MNLEMFCIPTVSGVMSRGDMILLRFRIENTDIRDLRQRNRGTQGNVAQSEQKVCWRRLGRKEERLVVVVVMFVGLDGGAWWWWW